MDLRLTFNEVPELYHRIRTLDSENYAKIIRTFSNHRVAGEEKLEFFCNKTKEAVNDFGGIINIYDTQDLQLARKP